MNRAGNPKCFLLCISIDISNIKLPEKMQTEFYVKLVHIETLLLAQPDKNFLVSSWCI